MRTTIQRERGLTEAEVTESRTKYGNNALPRAAGTPFIKKFLGGFSDPIIRILLGALGLNCLFLFKTFDVFETVGIAAAILCATLISALSERGGEQAFARLAEEAQCTVCRVRRDGEDKTVSIDALVVGDTVYLCAGDKIPADGVLTDGMLRISQAALNGEGAEQTRTPYRDRAVTDWKPDDTRLLLRGAVVTWGEGRMRVCRVGANTLYGTISGELQQDGRESPLKTRLSVLARQMSRVGIVAAAGVGLSYLVNTFFLDVGCSFAGTQQLLSDPAFVFSALTHALMLAATTVVMAVPEGLPMMISVVLSANIRRMQRDRVLVRKPVGIETAGSMDLLFCDKTGTLTCGRPVVSGIVTAWDSYPSYSVFRAKAPSAAARYAVNCACNTQSRPTKQGGTVRADGGNATDRALLDSILSHGRLPDGLPGEEAIGERIPFDSAKKYASATVGGVTYIKGAPEIVLRNVRLAYDRDGSCIPLDRERLARQISAITEKAGRVIAVCTEERGERVFLCLVSIRDDLRPDTRRTVKQLHGAGIRVIMMTGDSRETAAAIAREAGIMRGTDPLCLTSDDLKGMDDGAVRACLPRLCVVARALPQDKSRLVRLAQQAGHVVGMTGDGVNDAPALKCADVGFALGGGTEVAQEAGDIVILDDTLSSISRAVLYGRTIFKSIRKFIMFQMTTNLSAVGISLLCPLFGVDAPITVLQMLWINLIMDTLGSLAFAGEGPSEETMRQAPKAPDEPIMNAYMVRRIAWMGAYLLALCLWFVHSDSMRYHYGFDTEPTRFLGAFFALFIFADIANSVSARTTHINPFHRLGANRAFVVIFSFIITAQFCMLYFGGAVFRTCPLTPGELAVILILAATVLLWGVLVKAVLTLRYRNSSV
ncbi:MAG: calcium-translocating P-type ATPase, PMCA-type [Clostridia bacterium]|nr:calcium-translocating P-type ATPase, PMCA-type [Clostridia bacterium]